MCWCRARPEALGDPEVRLHPAALGAPEGRLPPEAPPVPGGRFRPGARFRLEDPVVRGSLGVPGARDSLWAPEGPVLPGGRESPGMGSRRNRTRQHFWAGGIWRAYRCCLSCCITAFLEDIFIPEYAAGEKGVKVRLSRFGAGASFVRNFWFWVPVRRW